MSDKVKVRILPFRAIGGYGGPGTEAWMPKADAEQYVKDGYVEILDVVPAEVSSEIQVEEEPKVSDVSEGHEVMEPEVKRQRKPRKKN